MTKAQKLANMLFILNSCVTPEQLVSTHENFTSLNRHLFFGLEEDDETKLMVEILTATYMLKLKTFTELKPVFIAQQIYIDELDLEEHKAKFLRKEALGYKPSNLTINKQQDEKES